MAWFIYETLHYKHKISQLIILYIAQFNYPLLVLFKQINTIKNLKKTTIFNLLFP